jgi:hypothetical protein
MRTTDARCAAEHLGSAAWAGYEAVAAKFPWPVLFADVAAAYDARYGLDPAHPGLFAEHAFARAWRRTRPAPFGAPERPRPHPEGEAFGVATAEPHGAARWDFSR